MHKELKQHLLLLKFLLDVFRVDQKLSVLAFDYLFFIQQLFNLGKIACVACHVSGQDYS